MNIDEFINETFHLSRVHAKGKDIRSIPRRVQPSNQSFNPSRILVLARFTVVSSRVKAMSSLVPQFTFYVLQLRQFAFESPNPLLVARAVRNEPRAYRPSQLRSHRRLYTLINLSAHSPASFLSHTRSTPRASAGITPLNEYARLNSFLRTAREIDRGSSHVRVVIIFETTHGLARARAINQTWT